jgi:AraC-like DNA-binding protein
MSTNMNTNMNSHNAAHIALAAPLRRPHAAASVAVLVAQSRPIVMAGIASTLKQRRHYDVCTWDVSSGPWQRMLAQQAFDLIVLDQPLLQATRRPAGAPSGSVLRPPKVVLMTTLSEDRECVEASGNGVRPVLQENLHVALHEARPDHVDARLSIQCSEQEFFNTLNGLVPVDRPAGRSAPPVAFRGGLAPAVLRRVCAYVTARLGEKLQLRQLAVLAGLSDCHFARAFKQSVGCPPHRYLMKQRVDAAAQLIMQTDRPLADIALDVGFSDQSHFTRTFVQLLGETPRVYRWRHR